MIRFWSLETGNQLPVSSVRIIEPGRVNRIPLPVRILTKTKVYLKKSPMNLFKTRTMKMKLS